MRGNSGKRENQLEETVGDRSRDERKQWENREVMKGNSGRIER
jgi:hypothetical protein